MTPTLLLALGCGAAVFLVVLLWQRAPPAALVIGGSIAPSLLTATLFGVGVPTLLHALRLDPKIAAGPVSGPLYLAVLLQRRTALCKIVT